MAMLRDALKETPSQTAGPYVHIGCMPNFAGIPGVYPGDLGVQMVSETAQGRRITVSGCVFDGYGAPVRDALIEIWQADAEGRYAGGDPRGPSDPGFTGWGRRAADGATGEWSVRTIKPGRVPFRDGRLMAPHLLLWVVARGINIGLLTRIYFGDEAAANAEDPVLSRIEPAPRAATLVAQAAGPDAFRFDIHLQGENETVFFDA